MNGVQMVGVVISVVTVMIYHWVYEVDRLQRFLFSCKFLSVHAIHSITFSLKVYTGSSRPSTVFFLPPLVSFINIMDFHLSTANSHAFWLLLSVYHDRGLFHVSYSHFALACQAAIVVSI